MDEAALLAAASDYVAWDPNAETRAEVKAHLDAKDVAALSKLLDTKLEFGTAGLRAPMQAGYGGLNELTVVQATQGLAAYLLEVFGPIAEGAKGHRVAIGFDHRARGALNSRRYACLAAEALASRGFDVILLPGLADGEYCHTPLVSYCVRARGCVAGIMITASHNPKADNGYKVYWDNGAQIIPPHDKGIAAAIDANRKPWLLDGAAPYGTKSWSEQLDVGAAGNPTAALADEYFEKMRAALCRHADANAAGGLKVVHTAMHGVGTPWTVRAFAAFGLPPPIQVAEQAAPDPDFPTVAFPNPEEGAGALELAMATAEKNGAALVLANDPDADRLAVAEKGADGAWRVLSGNEIGLLLADWMWREHQRSGGGGKVAMLSSAVSSRSLAALAKAEGFYWEETLTGFKWLCSRAAELRKEGYTVLLAFEEAIGFCLGDVVNDKDGVSASAVFAEMAGWLRRELNRSVVEHLDALGETLGHHVQSNSYVICRDPKTTAAIFERLRTGDGPGGYWSAVGGDTILGVRDLNAGVDTDVEGGTPKLPTSKSSHMITYRLASGAVVTLRGSGTEPKIKWYAEMVAPVKKDAEAKLAALVDAVVEEMLQPEKNGLERRK